MDERQVQGDRRSSSPKGLSTLHPAASRGLDMAGIRVHETLIAEGHYRCSCCRRADLNEMNTAAHRMR